MTLSSAAVLWSIVVGSGPTTTSPHQPAILTCEDAAKSRRHMTCSRECARSTKSVLCLLRWLIALCCKRKWTLLQSMRRSLGKEPRTGLHSAICTVMFGIYTSEGEEQSSSRCSSKAPRTQAFSLHVPPLLISSPGQSSLSCQSAKFKNLQVLLLDATFLLAASIGLGARRHRGCRARADCAYE